MFGPDDENLFSFLTQAPVGIASDPGGVPSNVLQSLVPPPAPPPSPPPQAAPAAAEPPKRRRSLLDTIGRISDVLAKVGGAEALYQPTLDAREDRTLKLGDHERQVLADNLKIAQDKFELGDKGNTRLAMAARGAKAILAANPNADIGAVWNALGQRMQLTPEEIQGVGQQIATDPGFLDGLIAGGTDPKLDQSKYGGNVVYAKGPDGKIVAFQPSITGDGARPILPEGFEAIDPPKAVDLGGRTVLVGTRSGGVNKILPNSEKPGMRGGVPIRERPGFRGGRPIAPPPAKAGDGSANGASVSSILNDFGIVLDGKLDPVADLIRGSTSGAVQNYASKIPGALGIATEGQEKIARLGTIDNALVLALAGGKLGAGVSNADRDFFKEMSGKISDPNSPANSRLAAWDQIKARLRGIKARETAGGGSSTSAAPARSRTPVVRPRGKAGWTIVKVQ